jgi:hypothetical protein
MEKTILNLGDTITSYATGKKVTGEIFEINNTDFLFEHEPVHWGNHTFTKTRVCKASYLQEKHGGSKTSPISWKDGKEIVL